MRDCSVDPRFVKKLDEDIIVKLWFARKAKNQKKGKNKSLS